MNRQELNQLIDDYAMAFADAEKARMIKGSKSDEYKVALTATTDILTKLDESLDGVLPE